MFFQEPKYYFFMKISLDINYTAILYFALILFLNTLSTAIGTLKSIFVAKQAGKITYFMVALDSAVYAIVLKSFSTSGVSAIIAYIVGHFVGAIIGNMIEKKVAIGLNDVTLYVGTKEKMLDIQNALLDNGYSTTASIGLQNEETKRYSISVQLPRRQMKEFSSLLAKNSIENPTMVIREIKQVTGKIEQRI